MNDIELIVLAAKAAEKQGRVIEGVDEFNFWLREPDRFGRTWAPLIDDGDALRLAVKLNITVSNSEAQKHACASVLTVSGICLNQHKGDPYAATRRAIVRAAAEIGKAMP